MVNFVTDPSLRSQLMSTIKSKNTKPETTVNVELRKRGLHFQTHYDRAPGTPDIARPRKKLAVFVDGDFWHGRHIERVISKHGHDSAWAAKLRRTMARDSEQNEALIASGWRVFRVWESDVMRVSTRTATIDEIEAFLRSRDLQ